MMGARTGRFARCAALAVLVSAVARTPAGAAPRLPASDAEVLEVLPWRNDPQQRELRRLRTDLAQAPNDVARAADVARRYIAFGRREADPRYFGYAQAALAPWWRLPTPPPAVRLLRATLLQTEHRFPEALADLAVLTAQDRGNPQAWLTRATVETVRADYAAATRSCAGLSNLADELVTAACIANVGAMTGRLRASEQLLAATYARGAGVNKDVDAWVLGILADMAARRGDAPLADERFRAALANDPRDTFAVTAYADFLIEQHRAAEALALTAPHRRIDGLLLRHALALRQQFPATAPAALREDLRELDARFDAGERRGDGVHLREQARYLLQLRPQPARALALARRNWDQQKELPDARLLLEAAAAAHDPAAARPALDWMTANHVEDAVLEQEARTFNQPGSRT
jgi:hypothetical protein